MSAKGREEREGALAELHLAQIQSVPKLPNHCFDSQKYHNTSYTVQGKEAS